jgi:hypothetical protein
MSDINLLNNAEFKNDQTGFPAEWCYRRGRTAEYVSAKNGELTIRPQMKAVSFNQGDIHLVPERRYRFGAEVRTARHGGRARLVVYNYAWTKDSSLTLPEDTNGEWKLIEQEFSAPPSRDELYTFAIYSAAGVEKEFSVRKPFLVPVSGKIDEEHRSPIFSSLKCRSAEVQPPAAFEDGRRLNALVRRLYENVVKNESAAEITLSQDHWVWIALDGNDGAISIDGSEVGAIATDDNRIEAMRFLTKGRHRIEVKGFVGKRNLIVNAVPTIMATSYPEPKIGAGRLTGEFLERYLYPAFNTFSYGWAPSRISDDQWKLLAQRGRQMYGHLCRWNKNHRGYINRAEPPGSLATRFRNSPGMKDARFDGLTFDEISASDLLEKDYFTDALRYSCDLDRPIWVWSSGVVYENNPVNVNYLNAIVASSGGRGRLLFECYARTEKNESAAKEYLYEHLDQSIIRAEKMVKGFVRSSMIVHGAYTRIGGYCTDCRYNADAKRFWDMYFHRLATSGTFDGLAGIGLYAINNGEEEDLRWASRVIRHYALEGRTDLLSDKYGFKYEPGHLKNGDFAQGADGWTVEAAEKSLIRFEKVKGFASLQALKDPNSASDTACIFKRSSSRPNILRQRLVGLENGKLYSLRFAVAALKEIASKKGKTRTLGLNAKLIGAKDVTSSAPISKWGESVRSVGVLNSRTIIFKALSSDVELVFSDWNEDGKMAGEVGEELAFNFVRVVPYYEK